MSYRLKIDQAILDKYPEYSVIIIYAKNLQIGESTEQSVALLRAAEQEQREKFGDEKPASHPHIAAWRGAYQSFGVKPSKYPCSVEALLSRTLKGNDLPAINRLVDIYNAVSIRHVLPVGGENLDKLTSDLTLTFATGKEPFDTYQDGQETVTYPSVGEVIWADSTGTTCRMWNWRQCLRTQITPATQNVYFVLDALSPFTLEALKAAAQELIQHVKEMSPDCSIESEILGKEE